MDVKIDHYGILGLASGEEGAKLADEEITRAYRRRALKLHPDKRLNDSDSHAEFQKLNSSYEFLKDEKKRKDFDKLLRGHLKSDAKRSKMDQSVVSAAYQATKAAEKKEKEKKVAEKLREQLKSINDQEMSKRKKLEEIIEMINFHARCASKGTYAASVPLKKEEASMRMETVANGGLSIDKEKVLNVFWEKGGVEYTAEKLREVFSKFGVVEDVFIKRFKKRSIAIVEMASSYAAVAAIKSLCRNLLNPLQVLPVQTGIPSKISSTEKTVEPNNVTNLFGAGFQKSDDFVLKKLQKGCRK